MYLLHMHDALDAHAYTYTYTRGGNVDWIGHGRR